MSNSKTKKKRDPKLREWSARELLHEAVVRGQTTSIDGVRDIVVGLRRPFIPCSVDPSDVNRECARRFAVWLGNDGEPQYREVDPATVVPFVDLQALLRADDERANAAQRSNKRKESTDGEA